jgi:hypothetical protein
MVHKEYLLSDNAISNNLVELKEAVQISRHEMAGIGMLEECRDCAEKKGGSCCGSGIENKYSGTLLLINLLLDCDIPENRIDPQSCFFLGENGCTLIARHVICVNYVCKEINNRIAPAKFTKLRENEGNELRLIFQLNEKIKKILRSY